MFRFIFRFPSFPPWVWTGCAVPVLFAAGPESWPVPVYLFPAWTSAFDWWPVPFHTSTKYNLVSKKGAIDCFHRTQTNKHWRQQRWRGRFFSAVNTQLMILVSLLSTRSRFISTLSSVKCGTDIHVAANPTYFVYSLRVYQFQSTGKHPLDYLNIWLAHRFLQVSTISMVQLVLLTSCFFVISLSWWWAGWMCIHMLAFLC